MKNKSDRALLAGLFFGGTVYAVYAISTRTWINLAELVAVGIEIALMVASLISGPPTKKELTGLMIASIAYMGIAFLFGLLTEVIIMAAFGIIIYAAAMTEPKFPLTKRAIGAGLVVGVIMTFLGIFIALKLGVVYFVGAEMLGALILSARGRYTPQENTIVVAIANGSSMIAIGVLIVFPAIAIFEPAHAATIITYPFIAFVTGLSAICGLLILAPIRERFDTEPWPQVKPQAECIIALGADTSAKREVVAGMSCAGLWVGAARVAEGFNPALSLSSFPHALNQIIPAVNAIPDWIGVSNSPLIASMGFFMGWKRVLVLALGSLISFLIWVILEGAQMVSFGSHLQRPEILYLALGVFASVMASDILTKDERLEPDEFEELVNKFQEKKEEGVIVIDRPHKSTELFDLMGFRESLLNFSEMKTEILEMIHDPRGYLHKTRGRVPTWVAMVSLLIFMAASLLTFSIFTPFGGLEIPWLLIVFGSPIVLFSAYFTAKAISETGMLAGYISDIIAIPAIIIFKVGFAAVTTFMSMLGALQDSAIALLVHLRLGRLTGVRGRDIAKAVFIGATLGTFGGSLITYSIYLGYGFGGTEFPAPAAQLFGFLVISLKGLGEFKLPGFDLWPGANPVLVFIYLISFGVVGYLAGRELHKRRLSAISLAVGVLIPPAASIAMLFGGFLDYRSKKKGKVSESETEVMFYDPSRDRTTRLLSGLVAGEAIAWILSPVIITVAMLLLML